MSEENLEELKTKFKKIKERVSHIIDQFPEVKGNYHILISRYYKYWHDLDKFDYAYFAEEKFKKIPSPESITRAYRKVREDKLKLGITIETEKTEEKRIQREFLMREMFSGEVNESNKI